VILPFLFQNEPESLPLLRLLLCKKDRNVYKIFHLILVFVWDSTPVLLLSCYQIEDNFIQKFKVDNLYMF
jgi:hypothetical protein